MIWFFSVYIALGLIFSSWAWYAIHKQKITPEFNDFIKMSLLWPLALVFVIISIIIDVIEDKGK